MNLYVYTALLVLAAVLLLLFVPATPLDCNPRNWSC